MDYFAFLDRLHQAIRPEVYLEIGVEFGWSMALSRSRSIGIDPAPKPHPASLTGKPWLKLYQMPSDAFFQTYDAETVLEGRRLDLAFIDGLHEFAQVARDLENVNRWGHAGTVVVIHDVLPRGTWEAIRAFQPTQWAGDVWRIVPFLREHRPELTCRLVDATPTGVLVVSGLGAALQGIGDLAAELDREFPSDGPEYDSQVEAFIKEATPLSPEAVLGEFPAATREASYPAFSLTLPSATAVVPHPNPSPTAVGEGLGAAWEGSNQQIELAEPVRIAYRVRVTLTAAGMAVVRLRLLSEQRGEPRERNLFLDVERPGALSHELERVALVPRGEGRFALELEGELATWESLQSIVLNPASAELEEVPATGEMGVALESIEIAETSGVSRVVRFVPDWPDDEPRPRKDKDGKRDAVIFAWYVPERMPELGEYYLNLLRYYHADSRIFIGMNHGSDPIWEARLRASGLDVEIRWARPEIGDYWDTTGFLAALEAYDEGTEQFDLIWFGHTKGGSQSFDTYRTSRRELQRRFWAARLNMEDAFSNPRTGLCAPRTVMGLPDSSRERIAALQRIYIDRYAPLGVHAFENFFVMRDEIVRGFCRGVDREYFRTDPSLYGADRWFFELAFPSIASMQGFEPFIDDYVPGENNTASDVSLVNDHRQNHRLAAEELGRWREDPIRFKPRQVPWANQPRPVRSSTHDPLAGNGNRPGEKSRRDHCDLLSTSKRDAVVFAWFVPEALPDLGTYFLSLLTEYHMSSRVFVGMNHGSDPIWEERLRASGLGVEIRWARPEIGNYWDTTGFLTALEAFSDSEEAFDLVWFAHSKGGSTERFEQYRHVHSILQRQFWERRPEIKKAFSEPSVGIFAPRFSPLPVGIWGDELAALERVYRDVNAPIGLHAKETFYVMRGEVVRRFCNAVAPGFFQTDPAAYGANKWFFEIGFPNVASMQGYEPFIDPNVSGAGDPRDDVWLRHDPKQNHRLALKELERWRRDPVNFLPGRMQELW